MKEPEGIRRDHLRAAEARAGPRERAQAEQVELVGAALVPSRLGDAVLVVVDGVHCETAPHGHHRGGAAVGTRGAAVGGHERRGVAEAALRLAAARHDAAPGAHGGARDVKAQQQIVHLRLLDHLDGHPLRGRKLLPDRSQPAEDQ